MKKTAKEVMLARIRASIANAPDLPEITYRFRERDERDHAAILEDFIERLLDYKATVTNTDSPGLPQTIMDACSQHNITHLVVPADLPATWIPEGVTVLRDEPLLSLKELDTASGVLTGCALAIAQTGTIILNGG